MHTFYDDSAIKLFHCELTIKEMSSELFSSSIEFSTFFVNVDGGLEQPTLCEHINLILITIFISFSDDRFDRESHSTSLHRFLFHCQNIYSVSAIAFHFNPKKEGKTVGVSFCLLCLLQLNSNAFVYLSHKRRTAHRIKLKSPSSATRSISHMELLCASTIVAFFLRLIDVALC